jgi:PKD repeat protein
MSNPKAYQQPNTYKGQYWFTGSGDNGGVHYNSGVLNYWFYLLCEGGSGVNDKGNAYEVPGIGMESAEKIAFKLLTEYLSPNSQYINAYQLGIQATSELFGLCSPETEAVGNAFYAVGVIDTPYSNNYAGFKASDTEICSAPATITFSNQSMNASDYLWDFGDGPTSTEKNPVHVYEDYGSYTVTLNTNGPCGNGTETKENYINIDSAIPCIFIMTLDGTTNVSSCHGIIYDNGGPNGNYLNNSRSTLIIHSSGATSIVLTILEFNIEKGSSNSCNYDYIAFYDGNSTSAPLINGTKYCNTTGNPGTISSTGEYLTIYFYSDVYENYSGYKISFCSNYDTPLEVVFTADKEVSCNGLIQFTDETDGCIQAWEWNFGDGNTSSQNNPLHQYTESGNYNVTLTVTSGNKTSQLQKENFVVINIPPAPEIENITACKGENFEIKINLDGTAYWYKNITDKVPVYVGNVWLHSPIEENITYFVREITENGGESCASLFTEVEIQLIGCSSINQKTFENIFISPNPSKGIFYINGLKKGIDYQYMITDISGKILIENQNLKSDKIDLSKLTDGIYFMTITSNNNRYSTIVKKY